MDDTDTQSSSISDGPLRSADEVALIFEGGGMRNAYTAAVLEVLLGQSLRFPKAYGVSAGAELACDYVAGDARRARAMFCEAPDFARAGGISQFLTGHGFFNVRFLFQELGEGQVPTRRGVPVAEEADFAFDFHAFAASPADVHIEALALKSAETVGWDKASMTSVAAVMDRIAASCSYPLFTPKALVDGVAYIDGGMGESHGICLEAARRDGFQRFFVVRTRPRAFRLAELSPVKRLSYRIAYAAYPHVVRALEQRPSLYNAQLDELDRLEAKGACYQFCPTTMPITYMTGDVAKLRDAYARGVMQAHAELPRWREWLGQ